MGGVVGLVVSVAGVLRRIEGMAWATRAHVRREDDAVCLHLRLHH